MKLDLQTLMALFFVLFLIISIWKIWAFLPNKQLEDDDRTPEAEAKLRSILDAVLHESKEEISNEEIFESMKQHKDFDSKLFWRFNRNRLNHLLKKS